MKHVPEVMLNEVDDDQFYYRMANYQGAQQALLSLSNEVARRDPQDEKFSHLREICRLWSVLLEGNEVRDSYGRTPQPLDEMHWLRTNELNQTRALAEQAETLIQGSPDQDAVDKATKSLMREFRKAGSRSYNIHISGPGAVTEMRTSIGPHLNDLDSLEEDIRRTDVERARAAVEALEEQANEGAQALEAIKRASGSYGDVKISHYYAALGKTESKRANRFRIATILLSALGGLAAFGFLLLPPDIPYPLATDADRYVRLIQKIVFVSGVFGFAAYLSRQSAQHRVLANWANTLEVQLRTFEAYLFDVSTSDVRDELRKSFAVRAFGDHPNAKGELPDTSASSLAAAVELVTKSANALPGSKSAG